MQATERNIRCWEQLSVQNPEGYSKEELEYLFVDDLGDYIADALDDVFCFLQITFCCLDEADTVCCILRSLIQTANLRTHFFRYCES